MTAKEIRREFFKETGTPVINSQGEPDVDYVDWLEAKIINATEREAKYKELWERQNELIKHIESLGIDSPFHIDKLKYERLKNKINALEQELNLNIK
jgi:hypothetical protein